MRRSSRLFKLLRDSGNDLPLVEGLGLLNLGWLSGAVSSKGPRAIGATALDLPHLKHASSKCVANGDKNHTMMSQLSNSCQTA